MLCWFDWRSRPDRDGEIILVNLSGRGDKDIFNIAEAMQDEKWQQFIREKGILKSLSIDRKS